MTPTPTTDSAVSPVSVDDLAQEIRRIDGNNEKSAGYLAEAIMSFLASRTPNTEMVVKALEWEKSNVVERWTAQYPFGLFEITRAIYETREGPAYTWQRGICSELFHTLEEAQAACQAYFDQGIRSALAYMPTPDCFDPDVEAEAERIYDAMEYDGPPNRAKPAWVPRGNSDKQEEARRLARATIKAGA